jgi:CRP-like cAMP-binding protein
MEILNTENKIWFFEDLSLTETLSNREKEVLYNNSVLKTYKKKDIIYFPEDDANKLYIIHTGKVKISRVSNKGKELILAILGEGEVFGELSITNEGLREEMAEALEESDIFVINTNDFIDATRNNPKFNLSVTKLIGLRLKKIQNRLESLYFKNTEERIKNFIKDMAEEHGRKLITGDEIEIKLKLKHEDIAKLTATTRQSVTTILSHLEKDGIILYDRNRILIKKIKEL